MAYADDSTLIAVVPSLGVRVTVAESRIRDLVKVSEWCDLLLMELNASKTDTMIVPGPAQCIHSHPHYLLAELWCRSLMTLLYSEWHLIPRWLFKILLARFPEHLLKGLVTWGSIGQYSMIDCFCWDAFVLFLLRFGVLFCSVVLGCRYTPLPTGPWSQWCQFLTWGCVWVWPCTSSICDSTVCCCIRSGVIWCTLFMVMYLWYSLYRSIVHLSRMCRWVLHAVLPSHIGTLMRFLAAEPHSIAGLYCSVSISVERSWWPRIRWCRTGEFQEQGQCLLIGLPDLSLFVSYCFPFSSFIQWVGVVGLGSTDWKSVNLSRPAWPCQFF